MKTNMRIALLALGTRGDVDPMMALATGMKRRGHDVTLMSNEVYGDLIQSQGLAFQSIATRAEHHATLAHPKLWHPIDGFGVMWRYMLRPSLQPTLDALDTWRSACPAPSDSKSLVVAAPVIMGARLAQEAWGLRLANVYTAATMLRTCQPPMTLAHWTVPKWAPPALVSLAWSGLDRYKLQPLVSPALTAARTQLGLCSLEQRSVFGDWIHSPHGGVTLFPDWFASKAKDWPAQVQMGDFVFHDDDDGLDPGLNAFLEAGSPPVVVMPGTGQLFAAPLFKMAFDAISRLGLRGIMLGAVPDEVQANARRQPAQWWCGRYQPFARLLPRSAALLHHGGAGSSAQALRAGIAQVVWPSAYDQFDNAMRLRDLGVAAVLPSRLTDASVISKALSQVLAPTDRPVMLARSAGRVHAADGLDKVCGVLESLA